LTCLEAASFEREFADLGEQGALILLGGATLIEGDGEFTCLPTFSGSFTIAGRVCRLAAA